MYSLSFGAALTGQATGTRTATSGQATGTSARTAVSGQPPGTPNVGAAAPATRTTGGPQHTATSVALLTRPAIRSTGTIAQVGTGTTARTTATGPITSAVALDVPADVLPMSQDYPQDYPAESAQASGLPNWAWALIGVGGVAVLGGIAYWFFFRDKPSTTGG